MWTTKALRATKTGYIAMSVAFCVLGVLLIPSVLGMVNTRINYDMLDYLPEDMDTVVGQNELLSEFGKGAFSLIVMEDMPVRDVVALKEKIAEVEHVESVVWYDDLADVSVPAEILPEKIYREFNTDHSTMMAVFFDTTTSADATMDAIRDIRSLTNKQCFVTGMSALVTDLKDLCEKEEPIYVGLAVLCACATMMLLLDSWLVPIIFLISIGMCIVINLGSNYFLGEISYITKALSAFLQLAVTMDYSIFLWHSYNEQRERFPDKCAAMEQAIRETFTSVVGSSATTIAGFIALCFMSYTMGRDLGIVMAKGVLLGVIGCVTVLPSLILLFDTPLQKTRHKTLIRRTDGLSKSLTKAFPVLLALFAVLIVPAYSGYSKTNDEVYNTFHTGLIAYTEGASSAADGTVQLNDGVTVLQEGIAQLTEGALAMKNGLEGFSIDGMDPEVLLERVRGLIDAARDDQNYSGIAEGTTGKVRFIWRTDAIES